MNGCIDLDEDQTETEKNGDGKEKVLLSWVIYWVKFELRNVSHQTLLELGLTMLVADSLHDFYWGCLGFLQ